jgi:hypothetical protein
VSEEEKMKLSIRPGSGSSLETDRGSHRFTYAVQGLPDGQEARLINHGTERKPRWHFARRLKIDSEMMENLISYKTADEALAALQKEVDEDES